MDNEKTVTRKIMLHGTPSEVWDALTNPEKTKSYMFNCEVSSDWKVGSPIRWKGNFQGYESAEQGIILIYDENRRLKYTSFDPNFGLEDVPENYLHVTYDLEERNGQTELITTIENFNDDLNRCAHLAKMWDTIVLPRIKQLFPLPVTTIEPFYIIGIAIRTTNENGKAAADIPQLWNRFMSENLAAQIPNKVDNALYCIYTDYEQDYTKPYTTILGCRVSNLDTIPEGFTGKIIGKGSYTVFGAKGKLSDGIVFQEWTNIWNSSIARAYTADFEVYDERAQHPENALVEIFIAV